MRRQRSGNISEALLKIGEVARRTGVTLRTIRYYQSLGLIRAACRTAGGMHLYHPEACDRAQLIRDLRKLDVSLGAIRTVLEAERRAETGAERARLFKSTLSRGLAELENRIQGYLGLRENLLQALETLQACGRCGHRPSRASCSACENLVHFEAVPVYIRALVN
jgi:MerR family transcriptional regulator, copper efflux regulator